MLQVWFSLYTQSDWWREAKCSALRRDKSRQNSGLTTSCCLHTITNIDLENLIYLSLFCQCGIIHYPLISHTQSYLMCSFMRAIIFEYYFKSWSLKDKCLGTWDFHILLKQVFPLFHFITGNDISENCENFVKGSFYSQKVFNRNPVILVNPFKLCQYLLLSGVSNTQWAPLLV